MWGSKMSQDKVISLRSFTNSSLPDSRLRAALIRHGGDINAAASELLLDSDRYKRQRPSSRIRPLPKKSPEQSPTADASKSTNNQQQEKELRRLAWRMFFMDNHALARRTMGPDQKDINAFITSKWKEVGSSKRQEYTKRAALEARPTHQPTAGSPIQGPERRSAPVSNSTPQVQEHLKVTFEQKGTEQLKPGTASNCVSAVANAPLEHQQGVCRFDSPRNQPSNEGYVRGHCVTTEDEAASPGVPRNMRQDDDLFSSPIQVQSAKPVESRESEKECASPETVDLIEEWPRKLASRLCSGSMLTRGKNLLRPGEELHLQAPVGKRVKHTFRGKGKNDSSSFVEPTRIARFYKDGRDLGRLAPDISSALAPALQTKHVSATCRVVSAPEVCKLFSEVLLEVSIFIEKDAFQNPSQSKEVEAGLSNVKNHKEAKKDDKGVDTERINVVHMITALGICEAPTDGGDLDTAVPASRTGESGPITEKDADSYCRVVDTLDEKQACGFTPSKFLSCSLREYQQVGVAWMLAREKHGSLAQLSNSTSVDLALNPLWKKRTFLDKTPFFINPTTGQMSISSPISVTGGPYGGILADEMGLGKTVQCIACIVHDLEEQSSNTGEETSETISKYVGAPRIPQISQYDPVQNSEGSETNGRRRQHTPDEADEEIRSPATKRPRRAASPDLKDTPLASGSEATDRNDDDSDESSDEGSVFEVEQTFQKRNSPDHGSGARSISRTRKRSAFKLLMSSANTSLSDQGGTLVVCPLSLVTQWVNEFNHHVVSNFIRVVTHYGPNRGKVHSISVESADVVVTTYGVLSSEVAKDEASDTIGEENGGAIFQLQWRRVILDEAHVIKGRTTQWARACYQIRAERRWCVTGTVIHNHVNDVFSLLHFLELHPWSSWAFWNKGIVANLESKDPSSEKSAMAMVRDIISSVTLRRKKSTKDCEGKPIIQLTEKKVEIVSIDPTPEEKDFYSSLHEQSKLKFDTFVAQGKVLSNYATVLELLLRLRQACDHPYLVIAAAPSKDSALLKNRDGLIKRFLDAGSSQQFVETVFKEAESGSLEKSRECPLCLDIIDDPVAPKECGHPACRACLTTAIRRSQKCPVCRVEVRLSSIFTLPRQTRFAIDLKQRWRSSAKIDMLLEEVRKRDTERKNGAKIGKTVVFSQFTSMLDLVGMALDRESFETLRIDGSVPQKQRASILEKFQEEDELEPGCANILLVSLRAGGVGLNLVSASHAILLDIHWNPQVDAQAQDRVHRHGQTRDVLIRRYIIKDTVEEKLLQVQARKQDLADGALGMPTDEDKKQARLSELKLLFSASG